MKPEALLKTIYLGDRGCKALLIDSWNQPIAIQVTVISRLKPGTTIWDYYSAEDIPDGWLVFSQVRSIRFEPPGFLPNEYINDVSAKLIDPSENHAGYLFELSIGSVAETGDRKEVTVQIEADRIHLEDPARPGVEIT